MHNLKVRPPCAHLRPFVRAFAQRTLDANDSVVIEPVPAQLEQLIEFDFGTRSEVWHPHGQIQFNNCVTVAGAQTRFAALMHLSGGVDAFGIFFLPAGFSQLFHVPMSELTNRVEDINTLVKQSLRGLRDRLGESSSFEDRVSIAEKFLLHRAARAMASDEMVLAVNYLFQKHGAVRISQLADNSTSGLRHFERKFLRATGATPKTFARVARFQRALDAKLACPDRTWLDIAHSVGYHDQMHMIHDFEKLGQDTPTRLIAQIGDMRPPAFTDGKM